MNNPRYIDQFCAGFSSGDAISNEAMILQARLRELGYISEIYSEHFAERDAERVLHYGQYHRRKNALIIYHHSFQTDILQNLRRFPARKILIFHNITPPRYVTAYNRGIAEELALARTELGGMARQFQVVLADSHFNAGTLTKLGFQNVQVMPVPVNLPQLTPAPPPPHLAYLEDGSVNVLFVGRIFPNKCHQDLLKAFYFFHKLQPRSRLLLVGPFHPGVRGYTAELKNLCNELGLSDHVVFTNMVTNQELHHFYQYSHIFLSMSDHEGFFVPLLESMFFGLPILAYGSSVIPETLGDSGVVFNHKDFARVAEIMYSLSSNENLRAQITASQKERLKFFTRERTLQIFENSLKTLGITGQAAR